MRLKSPLSALLLITVVAATTVSCGDSSGPGDSHGGSGSAGQGGVGGSSADSSGAGSSGSAGASSSTAGSTSGGINPGGSNTGGMLNGAGGDEPGHGDDGVGGHDNCPATEPPPGTPCVRGASGFTGCHYGEHNCRCPPPSEGSAVRTWVCTDTNPGGGGDTGVGEVTCPEHAKTGDNCATPGVCAGQQCVCSQQLKVFCF